MIVKGYDVLYIDPNAKLSSVNSKGWVFITCPNPKHIDEHPSCSFNITTGYTKCFVCGYSAYHKDIPKRSYYILEFNMDLEFSELYKMSNALNDEYLFSRQFDNTDIERFHIKKKDDGVLFPFWNRGKIVGYQKRLYPWKDVNNYRYISRGAKPLWYKLRDHTYTYDKIYVTEGVMGMMALCKLGYQTTSILGVGNVERALKELAMFDEIYIMFDNDDAGIASIKKALSNSCVKYNILIPEVDTLHTNPNYKDIMSEDNFVSEFKS